MHTGNVERRLAACGMQAAAGHTLTGLAAVFDKETTIAHSFTEIIRPGAFKRSLKQTSDILCLVDHTPSMLLGRTSSGTLRLHESRKGLEFELSLPNTQLADDILELAKRGDLGGMSFAFHVPTDGQRWRCQCRELLDVDLLEISVIHAWPAYSGTTVNARSLGMEHDNLVMHRRMLEVLAL